MDLSTLSDEELMKAAGVGSGLSSMSDEQLMQIAGVSPQQPQGFLGNTADALSTRWSQARQDVRNYPEMAPVIGLGAAAGSANDVIGQGVSALTPDFVKQGLATGAKATAGAIDSTQAGQAFGDALLGASDKLKAFMQANPRTAIALNTAGNVASLVPVGKAATTAATSAPSIARSVSRVESASKKLPSILGDTSSGVSTDFATANIGKGVSNRVKGAMAMNVDDINALAGKLGDETSAAYKAVDAAGAKLNSDAALGLVQKMRQSVHGLDDYVPELTPQVETIMNVLEKKAADGSLSVGAIDKFRRKLSRVSGAEEGYYAGVAKRSLDEGLTQLADASFQAGDVNPVQLLTQARAAAAKEFRFNDIADMVKKADGDPNRLKKAFSKYVADPANLKRHTPEEVKALKDAAKRGPMEYLERSVGTFGFDAGNVKNNALPLITAGGGAIVPGGIPLAASGTVLRQTGKYAARGKAQNVLDAIAGQQALKSIMQMPPAEAKAALAKLKASE